MTVICNREHKVASERLERIDLLLQQSFLESQAIDLHWERCCQEATAKVEDASEKARILGQASKQSGALST